MDADFHRAFLLDMKCTIETTEWKVGCGGETIEPVDGESKKVPRNVAKIYAACKDINEETDAKTLKAKFDEVRMIGHQAIKPGISFFGLGKRDTETQNFYDKFKEEAPRPK